MIVWIDSSELGAPWACQAQSPFLSLSGRSCAYKYYLSRWAVQGQIAFSGNLMTPCSKRQRMCSSPFHFQGFLYSLFENVTPNIFFFTSGKDFMLDAIDVLKGVSFRFVPSSVHVDKYFHRFLLLKTSLQQAPAMDTDRSNPRLHIRVVGPSHCCRILMNRQHRSP